MGVNTNLNITNIKLNCEKFVTFSTKKGKKVILPELVSNENFYMVFSRKSFNLSSGESKIIDLRFKIDHSKELDPWISLVPTLKCHGLKLISQYLNAEGTTELHLKNESDHFDVSVKKRQILAFLYLLGQKEEDRIGTQYFYY